MREFIRHAPAPSGILRLTIVACYILAFGTFENLGSLGGPDRIAPEELKFDTIAAIKAAMRLAAAALIGWAFLRLATGERLRIAVRRLLPLFLFAVWAACTSLWSPMPLYTLGHALEFLLLVLLAAVTFLAARSDEDRACLVRHVCLILFAYLVVLVVLALADPASSRLVRARLETETPLFVSDVDTSFVKNPAEVACIAALSVVLVVACRLLWGWRWTRWMLLPVLALGGGLLFVTQTRSAVTVALVLAGFTFAVWGGRRRVASAALLLCLALVGYLALDPAMDRAAAVAEQTASYLSRGQSAEELQRLGGRLSNWEGVTGSLQDHPAAVMFGYGYSMATPTGKMWREDAWRRYTGHNIILDVLAGAGLLGLAFFLWGFLRLTRDAWTAADRRLGFLALITILYAFLSGVFGDSIVGPMDPTSVAIFAILGLTIADGGLRIADFSNSECEMRNAESFRMANIPTVESANRNPQSAILLLQEALPLHGGVPRRFSMLAHRLPRGRFHFGSLYKVPDNLLPRLAAEGAPVINFDSNNLFVLALRIRRYIRRQRIAAVFTFSFRAYCAAKAATLFTRCKVAAFACDFSLMRKPLKHALFRLISRRDWIIANSHALLKAHARPGRPRTFMIYNGIEPREAIDKAAARAALGIPAEAALLLYAADFQPYKDHRTLLAAFGLLAGRLPGLYLALCGRTGELPRLIHDPALLTPSACKRVLLFGPRDDMDLFYSAADLYVHPCYEEGFGNAAAEAIAMGVPVVAADAGGLPEAIGKAGRLFDARNPQALAAAIQELLMDPIRRVRLGGEGRRRAAKLFKPESCTQNFMRICQTILEEP